MQVFRASIINPTNFESAEYIADAGIAIDEGIILQYGEFNFLKKIYPNADIIDYTDYIITPGFIDLHTHIPQFPAIGLGKGNLLPWLNQNIFPLEKKFENYDYALSLSDFFFQKAISCGTTTIVAYSSLHKTGTRAAIDAAYHSGINLYIGKVMMDLGNDFYKHTTEQNVEDTLELIDYVNSRNSKNINYVVTPRYAGSCSFELLTAAAEIASQHNLLIQTHLAENTSELDYVASLHPNCSSYTDIYFKSGIMECQPLLAHCIYLDEESLDIISSTSSPIVHCPSSNRYLMSGKMQFMKYHNLGLEVGLGTDVAGGYSLSMINEMREAIENSGDLIQDNNSGQILSAHNAFYAATLGAASILNRNDIGKIEAKKNADLVVHKVFRKTNSESDLLQIIYGNSAVKSVYKDGILKFSL